MGLGISVQQEKGWSFAADAHVDFKAVADGHTFMRKAFKHIFPLSPTPVKADDRPLHHCGDGFSHLACGRLATHIRCAHVIAVEKCFYGAFDGGSGL